MRGADAFGWAMLGAVVALAGASWWNEYQAKSRERHLYLNQRADRLQGELFNINQRLVRLECGRSEEAAAK